MAEWTPRRPTPRRVSPNPQTAALARRPAIVRYLRSPINLLTLGAAGVYLYDSQVNDEVFQRTFRTLLAGLLVTLDFKLNFTAGGDAETIDGIHQRTADRMSETITRNGGLYIKLGQQLGTQAAVLPPAYRTAFSSFTDQAPSVSWEKISRVLREEYDGRDPDEVFESIEHEAFASASIAQVHRARTKDGRIVAVKVQKPAIRNQIEWDLWSYRTMMYLMEKVFEIPAYFVATYVSEQMRRETSFRIEAENAERTSALLAQTPSLRDKVYIPGVLSELSTDRVLVMEYIEGGVRMNERKILEAFRFKGGMKSIMTPVLDLFACQIFEWKWVHCDPHPGNILVRPHPDNVRKPQIVLLDHGLYIPLSEQFRRQYSTLWRSLFIIDIPQIEQTARDWGVSFDSDMFASAILLRPTRLRSTRARPKSEEVLARERMSHYELQVDVKRRLKAMLENEKLIPRELIFLVRGQRMLQAANQALGSPSNRVNITAKWAARGYALSLPTANRSIASIGLGQWLRDTRDVNIFRLTLAVVDIGFWTGRLSQWFDENIRGKTGTGLEERLQKQFEQMAKDELGVDLEDTQAFEG